MHVLLVCTARGIPLYGRSGASAHLRGIAQALRHDGHRVTVVVGDLGTPWEHAAVDATVLTLPAPRWPRSRRARERAEEVHARHLMARAPTDVDLIWHRHALHDDAVRAWAQAHRVPRWLEVNAPLALERAMLDPLGAPHRARRGEALSLQAADRVFVVSQWLVPWARALGGRRVQWLPNGSDLRAPDPSPRRREPPVVGFLGSCRPWHRLDRLPRLLDALPDAAGLLVGDGPAAPTHPRLRRTPFTSRPGAAVAQMDVGVVLGGLPWVCPLKLFDYRALGLPVVSVPVGDTPHLADAMNVQVLAWGEEWPDAVRAAWHRDRTPSVRRWSDVVAEAFATD